MKQKIHYAFIVLLIIAFFAVDQYSKRKRRTEIESYSEATIAFTREIIPGRNGSELKFYFYLNEKLIVGRQYSRDRYHNSLLDKFYLVKYDKNNPRKNYIYLNEEIQADSTILSKAGFKYITYYDYDILTSSYVKKHK